VHTLESNEFDLQPTNPNATCFRQHPSASVSIRQHPSAFVSITPAQKPKRKLLQPACVKICQHTSAYLEPGARSCEYASRARQHTSAYVSIRQHKSEHTSAYVSIRQHTSAYVSIRGARRCAQTCYYADRAREHTSTNVSIREHT
jgi:hypothetical protein